MIRARDLAKQFGHHRVLDGITLDLAPGERVALLGLNGAGKTTLIRCLLGLIPFEGTLQIAGCNVHTDGRRVRERVGYVPQRAPHFDGTLAETVEFFSRLRGSDHGAVARRLLDLGLDLAVHGAKPVRTLSGGMLQKVLLALALGSDVSVLLLDEPTANLDPRARREFLRGLRQVREETTVLLASHRLADVEAVADRLLVLHGGRIAFDGTMDELWARAGAAETLWVRVPPAMRDAARARVESVVHTPAFVSNGTAFGVRVAHDARADVLATLREADIRVEDFWTESPSLGSLLSGALGLPIDDSSAAGDRE
ncbi:MAG: ABC transporter ATP-binding protein [Gemmatimonadota bacterium]|nr:ABC transporter ATP-binding protein [Gemmatimonadota bacterium]